MINAIFLLLPASVFYILFIISQLTHGEFIFGKLDLLVHFCVFAYLCLGILLLHSSAKKFFAKFLLLSYALFISLVLFEGVLRLASYPPLLPWPPNYKYNAVSSDKIFGVEGEVTVSTNSQGLRADSEQDFKAADYRILCIGGSTTENLYVSDEDSWHKVLQQLLSKKIGKKIYVANAGRGGHYSKHHYYQLKKFKKSREFDLVVNLVGINDLGTFLRKNFAERAKKAEAEALSGVYTQSGAFYRRSAIFYLFSKFKGNSKQALEAGTISQDHSGEWVGEMRIKRQMLLKLNPLNEIPNDLEEGLKRYRRNILSIINLCKNRNQKIIFANQPVLWNEKPSPQEAKRFWQHTESGAYKSSVLSKSMDLYNNELKQICAERKIPMLDLAGKMPKDISYFYDDCHFTIEGNKKVAELLAEFIGKIIPNSSN